MSARSPEEILRLFEVGINAGDADAVAALYEEDAILVAEPDRIVKGRAAILDGLKNFVAIKPRMVLNASRVVRNGGVAILYTDWTMSGPRPDGSSFSVDIRPTVIARAHADGTWLVVIDDPSVEDGGGGE